MRNILLQLSFVLMTSAVLAQSPQWIQRADFGNFGRHRAAAMAVGNKVYAGTGHQNGAGTDHWYPDWWEYDPGTNSWAQKADYPGNNGNGDQDIVAIGFDSVGYAGLGQLAGSSFYKYDPQVNQWTQVAGPPAGYNFTNTFPFRIGNKGYFPTLYNTGFFEFDPSTGIWTQLANIPFTTAYGIPTFAINDKGYIKNGAAFYEYKPATNAWTQRDSFPGNYPYRPRGIHQNGYGFIIGGFQGNPSLLPWDWGNEVWRYDPATDSWLQLDDFPGTTRRWAIICNLHEHVYYGLGTNGTNFNDFWEFNSVAGLEEMEKASFVAFPSPASVHIDFQSDNDKPFDVVVYNEMGKNIARISSENGTARFWRTGLPAGTYYYEVLIDDQRVHFDRFIFI